MTEPAKPAQMAFDLAAPRPFLREDFIVSPGNAAAVRLIDQWPAWPATVAALVGHKGSGKTHLAEIWAQKSGALRLDAAAIAPMPDDKAHAVIDGFGDALDETGLFHLINLLKGRGGHVLLTSEVPLAALPVTLPDLASRLGAATVAVIAPPDDALLSAMLAKLFADRQLAVDGDVIGFLAARIERSHASARDIVARLDAEALARRARITRPFAATILREWQGEPQADLF
jgi:chromosomal replication initiation ATPase DnaA